MMLTFEINDTSNTSLMYVNENFLAAKRNGAHGKIFEFVMLFGMEYHAIFSYLYMSDKKQKRINYKNNERMQNFSLFREVHYQHKYKYL